MSAVNNIQDEAQAREQLAFQLYLERLQKQFTDKYVPRFRRQLRAKLIAFPHTDTWYYHNFELHRETPSRLDRPSWSEMTRHKQVSDFVCALSLQQAAHMTTRK